MSNWIVPPIAAFDSLAEAEQHAARMFSCGSASPVGPQFGLVHGRPWAFFADGSVYMAVVYGQVGGLQKVRVHKFGD